MQHGGRLQPVAVGHPQNGDVYGSDGPLTLSQTALMCPPQDMRLVMPTATVVPATGTVKHGVAAQLSSSAAVPTPGTFDEEKRVALVLGRLYLHAAVTNLPDYRVRAILVQFLLAGVPIGQRLHFEQAIHHFTGIAAKAL